MVNLTALLYGSFFLKPPEELGIKHWIINEALIYVTTSSFTGSIANTLESRSCVFRHSTAPAEDFNQEPGTRDGPKQGKQQTRQIFLFSTSRNTSLTGSELWCRCGHFRTQRCKNSEKGQKRCRCHLKPSAKCFSENSQESRARNTPFGTRVSITKVMCFSSSLSVCSCPCYSHK